MKTQYVEVSKGSIAVVSAIPTNLGGNLLNRLYRGFVVGSLWGRVLALYQDGFIVYENKLGQFVSHTVSLSVFQDKTFIVKADELGTLCVGHSDWAAYELQSSDQHGC